MLLIGSRAAVPFTPLLTIALAELPAKDAGTGSGIINVSQWVSGALSMAILGAFILRRPGASPESAPDRDEAVEVDAEAMIAEIM